MSVPERHRIIVALSGSSAPHYGVRLLEVLSSMGGVETHAIVSAGARETIAYELDRDPVSVAELADVVHDIELGAVLRDEGKPSGRGDALGHAYISAGEVDVLCRSVGRDNSRRYRDRTKQHSHGSSPL